MTPQEPSPHVRDGEGNVHTYRNRIRNATALSGDLATRARKPGRR